MRKLRIIGGFQDTRENKEDLAITPYLALVMVNSDGIIVLGISITWIYHTIYIGIGYNLPNNYQTFKILTNNKTKTR